MITHQNQWNFLIKSAELNKLPHALLFYGEKDLAKKDFALEFSKFLIGKITPPDFVLIEPQKSTIEISQIRDLIRGLSFKPYLADFKLAVIDKAHLMTREAQNCFLKFLEEPKAKTFLILITEYPFLLLPTILSRTQKIRFYSSQQKEISPQFTSNLNRIVQSDLAARFQYAKDLAEQNLEEILDNWLKYFREILISRLCQKESKELSSYSLVKLKDIIRQIQSTKFLLSSTNINPRLALEILLMQI